MEWTEYAVYYTYLVYCTSSRLIQYLMTLQISDSSTSKQWDQS